MSSEGGGVLGAEQRQQQRPEQPGPRRNNSGSNSSRQPEQPRPPDQCGGEGSNGRSTTPGHERLAVAIIASGDSVVREKEREGVALVGCLKG